MTLRAYRTFQALGLGILGLYLLSRIWEGTIFLYINQRYVMLVLAAGVSMVIMAQVVLQERPKARETSSHLHPMDDHQSSNELIPEEDDLPKSSRFNLLIVLLPVVLGVLIPAQPLGTAALSARGMNTQASLSAQNDPNASLALSPDQRSVLDWIRVFNVTSEKQTLEGLDADVTGFIYHDPRLNNHQFMVGRFAITCCVADALAIGVVVEPTQAISWNDNQWVRVRGTVKILELEGHSVPMIQSNTVDLINTPDQPYLFP